MKDILDEIELQPDFPFVDITEANVSRLTVLLSHIQPVHLADNKAHGSNPYISKIHTTVDRMLRKLGYTPEQLYMLNHGISIYEAMLVYTDSLPPLEAFSDAYVADFGQLLAKSLEPEEIRTYRDNAYGEFIDEHPRATEVAGHASAHLFRAFTDHALVGTTLAHAVHMDMLGDPRVLFEDETRLSL